MNIPLTPELDSRLREEAARMGLAPDDFVVGVLRRELPTSPSADALSAAESRLLDTINQGFTEDQWRRYYELIEKRRAGSVNDAERNELTAMSDRVEQFNVRRMEALTDLARRRGTTLSAIMEQLQITPPPVI